MKLIRGFLVHAALLNSVFMGTAIAAPADTNPIKTTATNKRAKKKARPNVFDDQAPTTRQILKAGALRGVIDNSGASPELVIVDVEGKGKKKRKTLRRIPLGGISSDGQVTSGDPLERLLFETPSGKSVSFSLDDNGFVVDGRVLPFQQAAGGGGATGATGSPGPAGATGPTGATGASGPAGVKGADGIGIKSIDFDSKAFTGGATTLEFDLPAVQAGQTPVSLAVIRNIAGTSIGFDINSNEILVDGQRTSIGPNNAGGFNAQNPFPFSDDLGAYIDGTKIHIVLLPLPAGASQTFLQKQRASGLIERSVSIEFLG